MAPTTATAVFVLATISLSNCAIDISSESLHRERRAIIFPSGAVLQLSFGVSLPVSVPNRTLALSCSLQMVFNLPTDITQLHTPPVIARKREISHKVLLETYLPLETFLEQHGYGGRPCLLRSICEAAQFSFRHADMDLLEEVAHAVLTPSLEVPPWEAGCSDNSFIPDYLPLEKRYLAAECLGKSNGDCHAAYADCDTSPLDFISQKLNIDILPE